jgi:hypothetical protein
MKKTVKFMAIMLIAAASFGCEDKEKENVEMTPVEFMEYSLLGNGCYWSVNYLDKVIINSQSEMEKYVTCTGYPPVVDFSENTVLLANGTTNQNIRHVDIELFKSSDNKKYELKVTIFVDNADIEINRWNIAIRTSKISDKSAVTLDVEQTYN